MKTPEENDQILNESKLLKTLEAAINTSKKSLMNDGILLILWGTLFSIGFLWSYYQNTTLVPSRIRDVMTIFKPLTGIALIIFTVYFIFFRHKKVKTYTAISTRFVWIGVIIASNINVMVSKHFFADINFQMLLPLQMVLIGFALFVTGGIYRYYFLAACGVLMWIAAVICAGMETNYQYLVRGIADLICFVIPGALMYLSAKKQNNV